MKRNLRRQNFSALLLAAGLIFSATTTTAADFAIDPSGPNNGLFKIYSATFDAPLTPSSPPAAPPGACPTAPDPDACLFFRGEPPPPPGAITIDPAPSGVEIVADTSLCVQAFDPFVPAPPIVPPCATLFPTAKPSALDLTLSAGNTLLAINGGNIYFPNLAIVINAGQADETNVPATGASIVNLEPSAGTVPIDANGVAIFEIDIAPATAADFSTFTEIVTSCTGPLCALIPILTLDMQRYRLVIDWDPTFSFFTASFIGQTANNSMVFATLDSIVPAPDITVTDSVTPIDDLLIPFGDIETTATPADETVTVTNDGDADLTINQITQPAAPFSVLSDMCSSQTLAPAANCTLTVRFEPATTGAFNASFDIPSDDPNDNSITMNLTGTGVVPAITVTNSIPFGDVTVAPAPPVDVIITVISSGTSDLIIGPLSQPAAPFSILNDTCSNVTLVPTDNCTFTARFAPSSAGPFIGSFDIPSNDPLNASSTVNVSGTGTLALVPNISVTDSVAPVSDQQVPFDVVIVTPAPPPDETVTVTNLGTADLIIGPLTQPAAPFSVLNDTCSNQTLNPAENCTLTVRFDPIAAGMFTGNFDIPSNDANNPITTVNVSGTGAFSEITITDSVAPVDDLHIPYGTVIAAVETVTVTNNSAVDLTLGQATIADPLGPFSIQADSCAPPQNIITPGSNCTIDVRFAPAMTGTFASSLDIPSNDPNMAISTIIIDGTGASAPAPDIAVTDSIPPVDDLMIPFGNVTETTAWIQTVTITNGGSANLAVGMIAQVDTLADPFSILNDNCSAQTIAPATSCTVDIQFLPAAVGVFNDSFDIPSDDPDEPTLTFNVDGTGVVVGTGVISLKPSGASSGFFGSAISPATLLTLFVFVAIGLRRRFYRLR